MPSNARTVLACLACIAAAVLASTAAHAQSPKLAVVDTQAIISQSELGKAGTREIEAFQTAKRSELESMSQEIQALRNRLNEGQMSLSEGELQTIQAEMEAEVAGLRRAQEDANRELQKRSEAVMANIEKQVMPVISQIGSEGGYTMIFNKFSSGLVHVDESADITLDVIQRLNEITAGTQ